MLNKKLITITALIFLASCFNSIIPSESSRRKRRGCHKKMTSFDNKPIIATYSSETHVPSPLRQSEKSTVTIPSRHEYTISEKGNIEVTFKNLQTINVHTATNPHGLKEKTTYIYFVKTAQE